MKIYIVSYYSPNAIFTSSNRFRYFGEYFQKKKFEVIHLFPEREYAFKKFPLAFRLMNLFRLFFFRSDACSFLSEVKSKNLQLCKEDLVICSGPPFSTFEIGEYFKKKFGVKFVVDYRDPWNHSYITIGTRPIIYFIKKWLTRKKELKFLELADSIIVASNGMIKMNCQKIKSKLFLIENGANENEISEIKELKTKRKFILMYPGTFYKDQLSDDGFFKSYKKFIGDKSPDQIELVFLGSMESEILKTTIKKYGIEKFTHITERLELGMALKEMNSAWMFVLFPYKNTNIVPSSKIYDCLYLSKKILLTKNDRGILENLIFETNSGYVCNSEDEISSILEFEYSRFLLNQSARINRNKSQLEKFGRHQKNKKWEEIIQFINQKN